MKLNHLKISIHLFMLIGLMALMLMGIGALGLQGINKANDSFKTAYEDRLLPLNQLTDIKALLQANQLAILTATLTPQPEVIKKNTTQVEANLLSSKKSWKDYLATYLTEEEAKLAQLFIEAQGRFVSEGIQPALAALRFTDAKEAQRLVAERIQILWTPTEAILQQLIDLQIKVAKTEYDASVASYKTTRLISIVSIVLGVLFASLFGMTLVRGISGAQESLVAARQAEQKANSALEQLIYQKYVLDQHAIVSTTDMEGRISYVNDKFCAISGYNSDELMGQDHALLNSGLHLKGFFKIMYEMQERGEVWQGEICNRTKDDSLYWIRSTILRYGDERGFPNQYISISNDITERKAAELELQHYREHLEELVQQKTTELEQQRAQLLESDIRFTLAVEGADVGIWDLNLLNQELYHSPRMAKMLGYTLEELPSVREVWDALAHPDDVLPYRRKLLAHMKDASIPFETIIRLRHKNGQWRWILSRGRATRDTSGRAIRVSGTHSDITERKLIEDAAQSANLAKSEFLANMSHEIRTPMNGVIGMVDILQQTSMTPEQQRMLSTIANSSQTLLHLLNDILDYSKIEAGKLEVERVATPLKEVADSVLQLMHGPASAKNIVLQLSMAPELPAAIFADPTRLRQVLLNLLGNAIKFSRTEPAQSASVALKLESGSLQGGQTTLLLCVRDNGIGMSAEVVSKLFAPFTQADASITRQFGGTGLGLSISHRLVKLMGGQITVQSTLGEGSEFTVVLPLQEAHMAAKASEHPEQGLQQRASAPSMNEAIARGQLILLAEDNETNREVMGEQLRLLGYCAEMADDGLLALQKWRSGSYALLLTDCHMPQMDGFALTQAIRTEETPGTRLPIIAITANAMQGEAQRCRQAGMDDYLSKPLRLKELASMLKKWLPLPDEAQDLYQNTPE